MTVNSSTDITQVAKEAARLIAPVYESEDWTWGSLGAKVPTEFNIARYIIDAVSEIKSPDSNVAGISSGGLRIERTLDYDDQEVIEVYFRLGTVELEEDPQLGDKLRITNDLIG